MNASNQTQQEAKEILEKTQIVNMLSLFGNVRIGGSYYTELMYGPDIDISIACQNPRDCALEFLNLAISKRLFQKYQYGDFESYPRNNRPKSHIIVLILPYNKRIWEIEIWFVKEHSQEQIKLEEELKSLPNEIKEQIIQQKMKREELGLSKHQLSSLDIYKKFI